MVAPLWKHQERALQLIKGAADEEYQRILCAAPTGAGKSRVMLELLEQAQSAVVYTDRKLLRVQLGNQLKEAGFEFGVRASGHDVSPMQPIQLCMVQTEDSRVIRGMTRQHHKAKLVLVDEAHRHTGAAITELLNRHAAEGSTILGFTATPLGLADHYQKLIVFADNSECRQCGAHVRADTYAPDEPDLHHIKRMKTGDFQPGELSKMYRRPVIFGRVLEHWRKLEGEGRRTLLFAPDVEGSRWFCEELNKAGVSAGHIDAKEVRIGTRIYPGDDESARQALLDAIVSREVSITCNRFILREGIDIPEIEHGIFATAFGSLTGYLQSGGRLIRGCPRIGKTRAVIQDHGGNYHRHGSLNSDRIWELNKSDRQMVQEHEEKQRQPADAKEREPIVCPTCAKVRPATIKVCPTCQSEVQKSSRVVVQVDGQLREVRGDIYKPRKVSDVPADVKDWTSIFYRFKNSGKTFNAAMGFFYHEHGRYPNPEWPYMPLKQTDKCLPIKDVRAIRYPAREEKPETPDAPNLFGGEAA